MKKFEIKYSGCLALILCFISVLALDMRAAVAASSSFSASSVFFLALSGPERAIDQASNRASDRASDRASERASERAAERASERAGERASERASEKASERATERLELRNHGLAGKEKSLDNKRKASPEVAKKPSSAKASRPMEAHRQFGDLYKDKGFEAIADEVLILTDSDDQRAIGQGDFPVKGQVYLQGLGLVLTRVAAPKNQDLSASAADISNLVGQGKVDLNHIFIPETGNFPAERIEGRVEDFTSSLNLDIRNSDKITLGLVDTLVDRSHVTFRTAFEEETITVKDFVPYTQTRPESHGTAVASILVGHEPEEYRGLVPGAKLHAASVFFETASGRVSATTESLILALDWLVRQNVDVINMSLSGPPNRLLEVAIRRVAEKGVMVVAAVGNGGPVAAPLYPAAYSSVVAVTAVDKNQRIYLRAGRGQHVSFSAPGVNIPAALAGGGYKMRTGTSIAAPFVSAILAHMIKVGESREQILAALQNNALDLGKPGFDDIYGFGLIQALSD